MNGSGLVEPATYWPYKVSHRKFRPSSGPWGRHGSILQPTLPLPIGLISHHEQVAERE